MRENIKGFWILFGLLNTVHGYRHFQTLIPNGDKVPHPCGGGTWAAVGHIQPYHTRTKNAFGRAFLRNGKNWNFAVCQEDSDGDGLTNGAELGDPNCLWSPGQSAPMQQPRGHPGFCDRGRNHNCTEENIYARCRPSGSRPMGGADPHFDIRTPPPHFGKHPQSLLTERLGERSGSFGGPMGGPTGLGQFGRGRSLPGSVDRFGQPPSFGQSPRFDQPSFSEAGFDPNLSGAGSMGVTDPPMSGPFGMPRQSFPLDVPRQPVSRPFSLQDRSGSTSFDWSSQSSGTFGQPGGASLRPLGGVASPSRGSGFWQPGQPSPSRGFEPSRDSFTLNLNQRFLQGGVPERNGLSFRGQSAIGFPVAQSDPSMLETQVSRRIDQARRLSRSGPGVSAVDWRGVAMGGRGSQFIPQTGGRSGFMFK